MASQRVKLQGAPQWEVDLDFRGLNRDLFIPLPDDNVIIDEQEMRFAIGDFDSWLNWALLGTSRILGSGSGTPLGKHLKDTYNATSIIF